MALIFPGERLVGRMDTEAISALGHQLKDQIHDLETETSPLLKAIGVWWKWYEAIPRTKEKTFPFVGAANVVVPLIGITCDALASRALAQTTAAAPNYWATRTENERRLKTAQNMARYINWQADGNDFSIKHVLSDQLLETYVTGRSVCALHYRRDVRPVFFGRTSKGARPKQSLVTFHRGPLVEHVPREHILWDSRHRIGDAPLVVRKLEYSWTELRDMAKQDEAWDREAVEEIKRHPGVDGDEASHVRKVKDDLDLRDATLEAELHDVREVWVDWSMLGNRFEVPGDEKWGGTETTLVVHLHMRTGRVLRIVGMPYLLPYKPFVDFKFRGGRGVAKRLEMLQSIQTTIWNQALDARTRANAVWAITRNARHLKTPLDPSHPILVDAMDELAPFTLPSAPQQDLPLLMAAQQMAERWMGHSDPLLGRETRSGGHPAPATSTLALMEQVNVMSAGTDVVLQEELSRLGEAIAILDQQFETADNGRLAQILGPEDAASINEFLFPDEPIPGNYMFDVVALSRTENPDVRMRRAVTTAQANQNFWAFVLQGTQVIENPQVGPRMKAMWVQAIQSMSRVYETFLDASNIDDMENYLAQLDRIGVDTRNSFQQFVGEAQAAQAAQSGQGGGLAAGGPRTLTASGSSLGPGNGAAGGTPASFTGGGVLQ